ncbi:MAG: alpha/beta hydrolase [Bdellovibrionaceae bacterium]|nr:alpha/beta hydrolase [Pseudobdellovibrionaceae bacterium]NUM59934.1 alpha/beta hydrolase [Pseudobdellovibrionaceae bacterium]
MTHSSQFQIHDRRISYRRLGQGSRKILFFHGFPGSSAQALPFQKYLDEFDLEVVCIDRPGYSQTVLGLIEPFEQATEDIFLLLNELKWKNFEAVSVSGGTPYLFSILKKYSSLVHRVSIISGLGPIAQPDFREILPSTSLLSLFLLPLTPEILFQWLTKKPKLIRLFLKPAPSDLAVLKKIENVKILETALHEAFMQNGVGPKQDAKAFLSPWTIDSRIYPNDFQIWHGQEDQIIPVKMAKKLAKTIPQAKLNIIPNEGHYSLAFNFIDNILKG